jgi:hypothetical protein
MPYLHRSFATSALPGLTSAGRMLAPVITEPAAKDLDIPENLEILTVLIHY